MGTATPTADPFAGFLGLSAVADDVLVDRELPGLAARLAAMAAELKLITMNYPTWTLPSTGVGDAIEQAQRVREMAHNLTAVLAAEVTGRGLATDEGLSRNDWVSGHAPALEGTQSAALTAVGAAMNEPRWAGLASRVRRGWVGVDKAALIVRFFNDVQSIADPEHLAAVTESLVENADALSVKEIRRCVRHARMSLRPPDQQAADDARLRAGRSLTKVGGCAGLVEYRLRLDPEGAAILDAAIDPLARPRPDLDWSGYTQRGASLEPGEALDPGEAKRDPRTAGTRRADALLEIVGRAVASPEGTTRTPRMKLVVTMSFEALLGMIRGAGLCDDDEVLSPETVRRLACEASLVPAVLGAPSEVLDLGRVERFFTPAQRRALTLRDKGCSWPGCTVPPMWCEAHHVEHWCDGGATDLANGALLCGRHHTLVHERGLQVTVTPFDVTWHR